MRSSGRGNLNENRSKEAHQGESSKIHAAASMIYKRMCNFLQWLCAAEDVEASDAVFALNVNNNVTTFCDVSVEYSLHAVHFRGKKYEHCIRYL